jgi:hypothetical protein
MSSIETIQKFMRSDEELEQFFERVREYAELYLVAKQRQKGCDGMGESLSLFEFNICKRMAQRRGIIFCATLMKEGKRLLAF